MAKSSHDAWKARVARGGIRTVCHGIEFVLIALKFGAYWQIPVQSPSVFSYVSSWQKLCGTQKYTFAPLGAVSSLRHDISLLWALVKLCRSGRKSH